MIAVDTNVLVAAHRQDHPFHDAAAETMRRIASGPAWAVPGPCVGEFYAVVTHPRIFLPPSSPGQALDQLEAWFESPGSHLIGERDATWPVLRNLLAKGQPAGHRVHDARIAAICLDHGVTELLSADRDFSRFPTLRVRNPLIT